MSRAWHIATKELLQTRRDRLAALFTIVLPVVFTIFLGLIIGSRETDSSIPVAVVDEDADPASQQFLARLEASPLLKLKTMTADKIDTAVEDQKVAAALVIPKGFGGRSRQPRQAAHPHRSCASRPPPAPSRCAGSPGRGLGAERQPARGQDRAEQVAAGDRNARRTAAECRPGRVRTGARRRPPSRRPGLGHYGGRQRPRGCEPHRGPAGRRLRHRLDRFPRPVGAVQPPDGGDRRGLGTAARPSAPARRERRVGPG